jgi:hypothetical protein
MRPLHLVFTLLAASVIAACAAPERRPSQAAQSAVIVPAPAIVQAPVVDPAAARLSRLLALTPGLDAGVLALALESRACALRNGDADKAARLAVIDYSLPSTAKRLWVLDVEREALLFHEHVTHGSGTGDNMARRFSNVEGSFATSLGLFRTAETYMGGNGYSMRMDGLDPGFNDNARQRAIVMHGAWYANPDLIAKQGRLGRSQGCPALREGVARTVIDTLKNQQMVFSYADDAAFLQRGRSFACDGRDARQILASARQQVQGSGGLTAAIAAP